MEKKQLGNGKISISALGLGCMGMSEFYGQTDEAEAIKTLHRALDLNINFYDTADMYGMGANEALLAKAFQNKRDQIILATKFGFVRDPNNKHGRSINGSPAYVRAACDASLKRLQTDYIDLYYQHRVDPNVPIEETVGAMAELVCEGKVKYLGLSETNAETLKKAHAVHPISALQSEYSLWSRDPEEKILPLCEQLKISFVAYSPLGRGFLTSVIASQASLNDNDFRKSNPRFSDENFAKNYELVLQLKALAQEKSLTAAQLALSWVLSKYANVIPIPGTKRIKYLEENVKAAEVQLSKQEIAKLDKIFAQELIAGTRYTEAGMTLVDG